MSVDPARLRKLLEDEIQCISEANLRTRVRSILVEPTLMKCGWDYGQAEETYPCWKVVEQQRVGIVYREHGFGPSSPWGLIWLRERVPSMGQDSGWFPTFREAAADLLNVSPG